CKPLAAIPACDPSGAEADHHYADADAHRPYFPFGFRPVLSGAHGFGRADERDEHNRHLRLPQHDAAAQSRLGIGCWCVTVPCWVCAGADRELCREEARFRKRAVLREAVFMVERNKTFQVVTHCIMILLCLMCVLPFILLIMSSLADEDWLIMN